MNSSRLSTLPAIFEYSTWLIIALICLISGLCRWRRLERFYPFTCAYFYVTSVKAIAISLIAAFGTNHSYFFAYYFASAAATVQIAFVLGEIYIKVYGPKIALPARIHRTALLVIPGAIALSLGAASLPVAVNGHLAGRILWTMQQAVFAGEWAGLMTMLIYSRSLKINWSPRMRGLAYGLAIMLTTDMVMAIVLGRSSSGTLSIIVSFAGEAANIVCLLVWVFTFWKKEVLPARLSSEQINVLRKEVEGVKEWGIAVGMRI